MTNRSLQSLSDAELLAEAARVAHAERSSMSQLLTLLEAVDARKLYLGLGYSSLFTYCTNALRLSESAAYSRITAARTARHFPVILPLLTEGAVNLTTVSLLAAHLTDENHEALLEAAKHKTKREIEYLVACLDPKPHVASSVRRLPGKTIAVPTVQIGVPGGQTGSPDLPLVTDAAAVAAATSARPRPGAVAPLAGDRYLLKITLSQSGHDTLERARALLRHQVPSGDLAAIVDRALTMLVEQLERRKHGATRRPHRRARTTSKSRHVPSAVKRDVWARDEGRCAFVGGDGRCAESGFLEFHHVVPFAAGGATDADNLQLRCRAHNAYEATKSFDGWRARPIDARPLTGNALSA